MNQKKNKKIIVILIIVLALIILVGGLVLAYLTTDIFKGNKELFFKYATQIVDTEDGYIENSVKQYFEKKTTNSYTNEGSFKVSAQDPTVTNLDNLNSFYISFSGQADNTNSKEQQDISINYSDSVTFPVIYRKIGNQIGLQTDYVGSKFINFETDKINSLEGDRVEIIQNISNVITDVVQISNVSFSQEELNTYMNILQNIGEDKFSNVNDSNGTGYQLTLSGDELKDILVQILETLKNDQDMLEKLNEYIKEIRNSANITSNRIEQLIQNIQNSNEVSNENFSAIVYKSRGRTSKVIISLNEGRIDIQKTASDSNVQYDITIDLNYNNENLKLTGKISYDGLEGQNVKEIYEVGIESGAKVYRYTLENNVVFTDSVSVEDFTTDNSTVLTSYDTETVNSFLMAVEQRITEVNAQQMQELGLTEEQNPLARLVPSLGIYTETLTNLSKPQVSEQDVATFNAKFEVYQSTNLQGVTVRGLLSTIELNNKQQEEDRQIKEINFNGEEYEVNGQNIAALKEEVVAENYYRVEFERDQETGLIYRAVVNPK